MSARSRARGRALCAGVGTLLLLASVAFGDSFPPTSADETIPPDSVGGEATTNGDHGDAPEGAVAEEAAVPLDDSKERYFYLEAYWQRGLNYRIVQRLLPYLDHGERKRAYGFAEDEMLSGRIGFRIAADGAAYIETDGLDGVSGGVDLRRAFVYVTGDFFLLYPASFKIEMGVITNSFFIKSAWLRWRELPYVGTFKVGQYDPPYGLESYGSSNDSTFMEYASPSQAFAPGTKFGLQLANTALEEKLTWGVGWFADTQDTQIGDAGDSLARLVGRVTYLPIDAGADDSPQRRLLHLGVDVSVKYSGDRNVRYQSRPESFLAPHLVDTGDIDANASLVASAEAAWVNGPLSLQGESTLAYVGGAPGNDPLFWGLYGYTSYFLTGETRPYKKESGVFGHLEPRHPFVPWRHSGGGAWEIGGRYSYVDLADGDIQGGRMHGLTGGLNWYWNRYVRLQFNYQWMIVDDGFDDGRLHIFQTRIQLVI